jgi:hypothetical protein
MTAALPQTRRAHPSWRQRLLRSMPWHRRLALLACLGLFGWALSGLLHPLMHVLQPHPATTLPPQTTMPLEGLTAPAQVLAAAGVDEVQGFRLLLVDGEPYYQVRLAGRLEPRYWHARDGMEADLAARHAEQLARHYLASGESLRYAGSLDAFTAEYGAVNRLLPVARVDTRRNDSLRLYLDLYQDRLAALVDQRKGWYIVLFQHLHGFRWLDAAWPLRPLLMLALLGALVSTSVLGVALFLARRRSPTGWRRLHGWLGMGLALSSLMFAISGAWHLLHKTGTDAPPAAFAPAFPANALQLAPGPDWLRAGERLSGLSLLQLDGEPIWRLQGSAGLRYLTAEGQELPSDTGERYAKQRSAHYAHPLGLAAPEEITLQREFDEEYGFAFRRLPVLKARYANGITLYVDPLDGVLAAKLDSADRAEGWSFRYLHKWDFLSALGKPMQDGLLGTFALAHLLLVVTGLRLLRRRRAAG